MLQILFLSMKRSELKRKLDAIDTFQNPDGWLEQYQTPPELAADILWNAYMSGDIENKKVCDLGCGTGIFSIGASLLKAKQVLAVDKDPKVIETAKRNAKKYDTDIEFIVSDIKDFDTKNVDTVIQNPPFGCQKKGADLPFLKKALEIAPVIYTMHRSCTFDYLKRKIDEYQGVIVDKMSVNYPIPNTMDWHDEKVKKISVDVMKIEKR